MTSRPTLERIEEIRIHTKVALNIPHLDRCCILNPEAAQELIAEIDALKAELEQMKISHNMSAKENIKVWKDLDKFKSDYETLRSECNTHRENARAYKAQNENLKLCQKIDGIALASLNEKNQKLSARLGKLMEALKGALTYDPMVDCYKLKMWHEYMAKLLVQLAQDDQDDVGNALCEVFEELEKLQEGEFRALIEKEKVEK